MNTNTVDPLPIKQEINSVDAARDSACRSDDFKVLSWRELWNCLSWLSSSMKFVLFE